MYFQDILQGIASDLMDSNLFQLKSSAFRETYRGGGVPVTWGFLPTYFQSSVGLFFWEYQIDSLIWVIGHSGGSRISWGGCQAIWGAPTSDVGTFQQKCM